MNEMIERVARALWVNRYGMGQVFDRFAKDRVGDTSESQAMLDKSFGDARAAIEAMREPSSPMLSAGRDEWCACDPEDSPLQNAHDVYQAMIDEALK